MNKEFIKDKIYSFFIDREGDEIIENIDEIDFINEGILDSLDFFSLATYIEKEFKIKLNLTDESTFREMRRIQTLVQLIKNNTEKS